MAFSWSGLRLRKPAPDLLSLERPARRFEFGAVLAPKLQVRVVLEISRYSVRGHNFLLKGIFVISLKPSDCLGIRALVKVAN